MKVPMLMKQSIKKQSLPFVQINNEFLNDDRLSFKAKGLFAYMFSKPDNWNFTIKSISTQQDEGVASIRSALNELKEYGYVSYKKNNDGSGEYYLMQVIEPQCKNPNVDNRIMQKSHRISNKDIPIKKDTYTDDFNYLWSWYMDKHPLRRIGDKKKAYSKYLLAKKLYTGEIISKGIGNYVNSVEDKKYLKHFATLLNEDLKEYANNTNEKGWTK